MAAGDGGDQCAGINRVDEIEIECELEKMKHDNRIGRIWLG